MDGSKITDAAVDAAYRAAATVCAEQDGESVGESLFTDAEHMAEMRPILRAALEAALPHLAAPKARDPVSVSERDRFETWAANEFGWGKIEFRRFDDGSYLGLHAHTAWRTWQSAFASGASAAVGGRVLVNIGDSEAEYIRAGNEEAARQPVGEVVAHVPVHPRQGPRWSDTVAAGSEVHRSNSYPLIPLYAAPPQQPERVDLEQFRQAVLDQFDLARQGETWSRHSRIKMQAAEAERDRLLALIDAQAK